MMWRVAINGFALVLVIWAKFLLRNSKNPQPAGEILLTAQGTMHCLPQQKKACVYLSPDLGRFYLWLIPRHFDVKPTRYPCHVSFIRNENPNWQSIKKWDGRSITVQYDPCIKTDGTYWFCDVFCDLLCDIRKDCGLAPQRRKASGFFDRFHFTVGNQKGKRKWAS